MAIAIGRLLLGPSLGHRRRLLKVHLGVCWGVSVSAAAGGGIIIPRDDGTVRGTGDDKATRGPGPDQQGEAGGGGEGGDEDEDAEGEPEEGKEDAAADGHGGDGEGEDGEEDNGQRGEEEEGCGGGLVFWLVTKMKKRR